MTEENPEDADPAAEEEHDSTGDTDTSETATEGTDPTAEDTDNESEESEREYGVVQEDAPDSIEEIEAPEAEQAAEHDPLAGIESPNRETAPQSRFSSGSVTVGLLVLLIGIAVAYLVPLLIAG